MRGSLRRRRRGERARPAVVGGDAVEDSENRRLTDPAEARRFVKETGIDALAAGPACGCPDPQAAATAAAAITRAAARTARVTRAAITGTNRSYGPGTPDGPGGTDTT